MARPRTILHVLIATANAHKVRELAALLRLPSVRLHSLAEFPDVRPVAETGRTFASNAIKKAIAASRATGLPALADDSGIEVDALGGAPGIRSARFAGAHGDDRANNAKLLRALRGVPARKRGAQYRCALALALGTRVLALAEGIWRGRIAGAPRGTAGFGYDPLFLVPGAGKTVGELPSSVKRRLSHRAMAARRLRPALQRLSAPRRRGC